MLWWNAAGYGVQAKIMQLGLISKYHALKMLCDGAVAYGLRRVVAVRVQKKLRSTSGGSSLFLFLLLCSVQIISEQQRCQQEQQRYQREQLRCQ